MCRLLFYNLTSTIEVYFLLYWFNNKPHQIILDVNSLAFYQHKHHHQTLAFILTRLKSRFHYERGMEDSFFY